MTSNRKRMLQSAAILMVGWWSVAARAQNLENPAAAPAAEGAAPVPVSGIAPPTGFGDAGQMVLSAEQLFGYEYAHQSNHFHANSFSLLGDGLGPLNSAYNWPRLGFDDFVARNISLGLSLSFFRTTNSNPANLTEFEAEPRIGYATLLAPNLGFWGRLGYTYVYGDNNDSHSGLTLDAALAIIFTHVTILVGPNGDIGLTGTVKYTDVGASVGLAIPL